MPNRKEIEAQIAALTAELDSAETDDAVWIKDGDHEIKVSGKRATSILKRYAKLWETDDVETEPGDEEGPETEEDESAAKPDAKPSGGYFGRGSR